MINEEITRIKDKLLQTIKPDQIYLFGSYAKDTYHSDRYYDFYIIVPDDTGNTIKLSQKFYCMHCQQAAEKIIKALVIAVGGELQRTHDLELRVDQVSEIFEISDDIYKACADLTPYGVKIRYQ